MEIKDGTFIPLPEMTEPKPTLKWLRDQTESFKKSILMNQGALNFVEWMIKNGVFVEEEQGEKKEG